MKTHCRRLALGNLGQLQQRIRAVSDWWSQLDVCGEPGATTWEVLETLRQQVTDCLSKDPPDIDEAESLTAIAQLRMTGQSEL